jgi:drug/metabolite transporter superfamily protein YnfA
MSDKIINEFEKAAAEQGSISTLSEFWYFLRQNKKWWLLPILVSLVLFGAFMTLSGTAFAPFIYTLF